MSEAYLSVFDKFDRTVKILMEQDKWFKKNPKQCASIAAAIVEATLYSKFSEEKEIKVYYAMIKTMKEKLDIYKELGDSARFTAAQLILAAEIKRAGIK